LKLIVQIPCFNEEQTLPQTILDIPRQIEGIDIVETLIIDDGCKDNTCTVAEEFGVDHIVKNTSNKGLASTFFAGLDASLRLGADIIVNTDGDNQYNGQDIPKLIEPILNGEADIVIGDRQPDNIQHFSPVKKKLQKIGSFVVRLLSDTDVPDAVSGFRAFSRKAAMETNIISDFSYTIETLIQAGKKRLAVTSVPIKTNSKTRESRLYESISKFLLNSMSTIARIYMMYQPLKVFFYIGGIFIIAGLIPSIRFLIYYLMGQGTGHIQSLILSAVLLVVGFQILMIGLVADVIACNRRLIEETLLRVRYIEMDYLNSDK
jgi:glycosyltransferase involved in cell wall biosynthesis